MSSPDTPFELLETLRWTPQSGFDLLERHVERLQGSARYFGFACPLAEVLEMLARDVASSDRELKVRLLLSKDGGVRTEHVPLDLESRVLRLGLAKRPIDPADPFLFHKTTNRTQQERERSPDYDEIILWNPSHEVTEAMTANIVVERDGQKVTPPIVCGLLGGTMRAELLASGEISEARISIDQLRHAPRFWLINSVRGWREARLST